MNENVKNTVISLYIFAIENYFFGNADKLIDNPFNLL